MGRDGILVIMVSVIVVLGSLMRCSNGAGLSDDFYKKSCPQVEQIVRNITWNRAATNTVLAAKLLRMHFHDCFVMGCDGSILLDDESGETEKDTIPNGSLSGYDVIDDIKDELERVCPGVVSCADILALAARDSVSFPRRKGSEVDQDKNDDKGKDRYDFYNPRWFQQYSLWKVQTGRRDGNISLASEANENLPSPFAEFAALKEQFAHKKLNVQDLVVLSGAHTIGVANCATFSDNRLYSYSENETTDPTLDSTYAELLKTQCPNPTDFTKSVEMDHQSSLSFDSNYFDILLKNKGLLTSDATLLTDPESAKIVRRLRQNNVFFREFALSMRKMGAIGVLTGDDGEIRKNCRRVNPSESLII
ncbi:Peroxidase superfamily protein [Euphorbia peplus]|nr:Peroxidase superfamily protein [Euphorbia peplus]